MLARLEKVQVFRINGQLVVALSMDEALNLWRMYCTSPTTEVLQVERVTNLGTADNLAWIMNNIFGDNFSDEYLKSKEKLTAMELQVQEMKAEICGLKDRKDSILKRWEKLQDELKAAKSREDVLDARLSLKTVRVKDLEVQVKWYKAQMAELKRSMKKR